MPIPHYTVHTSMERPLGDDLRRAMQGETVLQPLNPNSDAQPIKLSDEEPEPQQAEASEAEAEAQVEVVEVLPEPEAEVEIEVTEEVLLSEPSDEEDEAEDRPAGNASTEEWVAFRLAQGYSKEELEDLGRNELRDLADL